MVASVAEQCRAGIITFEAIISELSKPNSIQKNRVSQEQVKDKLEKFSLWTGNIGAWHQSESLDSLESRLCKAKDVLAYTMALLDDLNEVAKERRSSASWVLVNQLT
jgi:hypothetical protein